MLFYNYQYLNIFENFRISHNVYLLQIKSGLLCKLKKL